jgi:hypothetical protein
MNEIIFQVNEALNDLFTKVSIKLSLVIALFLKSSQLNRVYTSIQIELQSFTTTFEMVYHNY